MISASHGQSFRERGPVRAISGLVTCVWVQQIAPTAAGHYAHHTVPNGATELLCVIGESPRVVGPQTTHAASLATAGSVVGVRFWPGAAGALLGLPIDLLADLDVEATALLDADAVARLTEAVATAPSPWAAATVLESFVAEHVSGRTPDLVALRAAHRLRGRIDLRTLCQDLEMSERQLRRRVRAAVGVGPKELQRMLRYQRFVALAHADARPATGLARLAADAGYADQAHLTREAVRLGGRTPSAMLREASIHCHGAHDHAASFAAYV